MARQKRNYLSMYFGMHNHYQEVGKQYFDTNISTLSALHYLIRAIQMRFLYLRRSFSSSFSFSTYLQYQFYAKCNSSLIQIISYKISKYRLI